MSNFKNVIKRLSVVLLVVVLLTMAIFSVSRPVKVKGDVIVAGTAVIAALTAFMSAAGLTLTNTGIQSGGLQGAWEDIAGDFSYNNQTLQSWYNNDTAIDWLIGKENRVKTCLISAQLAEWFNEFKKWVVNKFSISSVATSLYGDSGYLLADGTFFKVYGRNEFVSADLGIFDLPLTYDQSKVFDFGSGNVLVFNLSNDNVTNNHTFRCYTILNGNLLTSGLSNYVSGNANNQNVFVTSSNPYVVGGRIIVYWRRAGMNETSVASGSSLQTFFDSLSASSISVEGVLNDGYEDFDNALTGAIENAGTGENAKVGVSVGDVAVDLPVTSDRLVDGVLDQAASNTLTGELVGGYADEKEAENELNAEVVPSTGDIEGGIVIVDGLEDFFPFCIPWDIYELIKKFNVAPEAPVIHWTMNFAGRFDDEEITLDFTQFEPAARIFRILIVIGFSLFLIIKTRDLIRG